MTSRHKDAITHSLSAALDWPRVIAFSTMSGAGLWIDRHWWVELIHIISPVEAKFSVDGPVGASRQWQEACRWRHQWIDVMLVKQVYRWIIGRCDQKVSGVNRWWGKVDRSVSSVVSFIEVITNYNLWSSLHGCLSVVSIILVVIRPPQHTSILSRYCLFNNLNSTSCIHSW